MNASKRILIVCYSLTGNTARVARELAMRLHADVEILQAVRHGEGLFGRIVGAFNAWRRAPARIGALQYDPANYALTLIGTPVWVGQMAPAVRTYLCITRGRIRRVGFFVTSGETDVEKLVPSLQEVAGLPAIARVGFNAHELKDAQLYQTKLSAFVETIESSAAQPALRPVATQPSIAAPTAVT